MSYDDNVTNAAVIAALAERALEPHEITTADTRGLYAWVLPAGHTVHLEDAEQFADFPHRPRGSVVLAETASFQDHVRRLGHPGTVLYADQEHLSITAVFNDHQAGAAGWRDHRTVLQLRTASEWKHWFGQDGKMLGQVQFAEHVEDGISFVVTPPAADLLEVVSTLQAKRQVEFAGATRLQSGDTSFSYHEDTKATGGRAGQLEIPERFTVAIRPWAGGTPMEVQARLRYRLEQGRLLLGYRLHRVDEVLETAWTDLVEDLTGQLDFPVLHGAAGADLP